MSALVEVWSWQRFAACRGLDSTVFYSPSGERGLAKLHRDRRAQEICADCNVRSQCADFALRYGERHGVWGGMSENERCAILDASHHSTIPPDTSAWGSEL
ncbi:WhiB family transcriptional regulator [Streptomyces chiangmaiensis]|uniref:Transcriptional regulator WhiB n=1 Tax=Streptomyces chiangmaiensis TaxID=766497 RepID=A0ABU7FW76_9ACTN|nr:WhiB family transcriptional regulator [Streptomyces chiangmaiensis]MED7828142.1 WhiB family transcriptional regulator [Streptomyces chiangmaiensis]